MQYVLNTSTGGVFEATPKLMSRKGFMPCDADGKPLGGASIEQGNDKPADYLLNPATGAILNYTLLLAKQPGLIPVASEEEGKKIFAQLSGENPEAAPEVEEPAAPLQKEETAPSVLDEDEKAEALREDDSDLEVPEFLMDMKKAELVQYAMENHGETLNSRNSLRVLRESVAVMIQKSQNNADAAME